MSLQASVCISCVQAHNEFILPSEKEGFIHRMRDIIRRAEALMRREPLEPLGPGNVLRLPYLSGAGTLSGSQVGSGSFRNVFVTSQKEDNHQNHITPNSTSPSVSSRLCCERNKVLAPHLLRSSGEAGRTPSTNITQICSG